MELQGVKKNIITGTYEVLHRNKCLQYKKYFCKLDFIKCIDKEWILRYSTVILNTFKVYID